MPTKYPQLCKGTATPLENLFLNKRTSAMFSKEDFSKRGVYKNPTGINTLIPSPLRSTSTPLPKKVKCFKCQTNFLIKFVVPQQGYSLKNNWGYWTGQIKETNQFICDTCLQKFYRDKSLYWSLVKDLKKRQQL